MTMATIDWPAGQAYQPRALRFGVASPKSGFGAFFTGQRQVISHLADRLRCTVTLPPCGPDDGQRREAFFMSLVSTGDWVRLQHMHRSEPLGTLRGLPTVATSALAGARTLRLNTTPGATLEGGDLVGTGGQLIINLRAEADPASLMEAVKAGVEATAAQFFGLKATLDHEEHFRPGKPTPTHRDGEVVMEVKVGCKPGSGCC